MNTRKTARAFVLGFCTLLKWLFGIAVGLYGAGALFHKKYSGNIPGPQLWKDFVSFVVDWGWIPVVAWLALQPILAWVEKRICPPLKERVIDKLVAELFERTRPANAHDGNFRVTLFKYRTFSFYRILTFKWPWGEWLCPYERSGFQRQSSKNRWRVSRNKPKTNEGVAGVCFAQEDPIHIEELPDGELFKIAGARENKKIYSKTAYITVDHINKKLQKEQDYQWPRSFWGVRVLVSGKPWGVILIDSTLPKIGQGVEIQDIVRNFLKSIDLVLSLD